MIVLKDNGGNMTEEQEDRGLTYSNPEQARREAQIQPLGTT